MNPKQSRQPRPGHLAAVASGIGRSKGRLAQPADQCFTNSPDGAMVWAGLVQSGNTLYGTTRDGGTNGFGTILSVNLDGSGFKTLHNFSATNNRDGYRPYA